MGWQESFGGRWGRRGDSFEDAPITEQLGEDANRIGDLLAEHEALAFAYAVARDDAMVELAAEFTSANEPLDSDVRLHRRAVEIIGAEKFERMRALKVEIKAVEMRTLSAVAWSHVANARALSPSLLARS